MGGTSAERQISLETGNAVHAALLRKNIDAHAIDTRDGEITKLVEQKFDHVFIALHGRGGEDGIVQGALESLAIPYTGSGVLGSALAMDKTRSKWIWQRHDLQTPACIEIRDAKYLEQATEMIGFPMMVKPVREGSSCGAAKVMEESELCQAWEEARKYDDRVMAEAWIEGVEYTVSILKDEILPLIQLETPREFYDFQAKYSDTSTRYICPCDVEEDVQKAIGTKALTAFRLINASGWGRVDLIVDLQGIAWLIEVNTIPGMTSHSLVPMAAKQAGIEFDDLVLKILETCQDKESRLDGVSA